MLALEPLRRGGEYELSIEWVLDNVEPWDWPNCWCESDDKRGGEIHELEWNDATTTRGRWEALLNCKRNDEQYFHLVNSIREFGFLAPATVRLNVNGTVDTWGDGHHRLAAMIELGYTCIPVQAAPNDHRVECVRRDSGAPNPEEWDLHVNGEHISQALALRGY